MDNSEFCHTDGQLLVAAIPGVENQAMAWAVHRLQCPFLLLDVKDEHVVFVILPMSRGLPEFAVVHIWRND